MVKIRSARTLQELEKFHAEALKSEERFQSDFDAKQSAKAGTIYVQQLQVEAEARERQMRLQIDSIGLTQRETDVLQRRAQIEEQFIGARNQLNAESSSGRLDPSDYASRLADLESYHAKAIESEEQFQIALDAARANGSSGARRAFREYQEGAKDAASRSYVFWKDATKGIEDSLTSLLTTGRANFHDLVQSMLAEAVRLNVVKPLLASLLDPKSANTGGLLAFANVFGSLFGGSHAGGGDIAAGRIGIVGERGAELVKGPATVLSNASTRAMLGAGGSNVDASIKIGSVGPGVSRAEIYEMIRRSQNEQIQQLRRLQRQGLM